MWIHLSAHLASPVSWCKYLFRSTFRLKFTTNPATNYLVRLKKNLPKNKGGVIKNTQHSSDIEAAVVQVVEQVVHWWINPWFPQFASLGKIPNPELPLMHPSKCISVCVNLRKHFKNVLLECYISKRLLCMSSMTFFFVLLLILVCFVSGSIATPSLR